MSDVTLTVGDLQDMMADLDEDTRIRLDIPVLRDTYDCVSVKREVKAHQPDELILGGYDD